MHYYVKTRLSPCMRSVDRRSPSIIVCSSNTGTSLRFRSSFVIERANPRLFITGTKQETQFVTQWLPTPTCHWCTSARPLLARQSETWYHHYKEFVFPCISHKCFICKSKSSSSAWSQLRNILCGFQETSSRRTKSRQTLPGTHQVNNNIMTLSLIGCYCGCGSLGLYVLKRKLVRRKSISVMSLICPFAMWVAMLNDRNKK